MTVHEPTTRKPPPGLKLLIDLGPLAAFFAAYALGGLMVATAVLMGATIAVLALGYAVERRIARMPLITAVVVLVLGGLTLWLKDETFIKRKPTVVYLAFAAVLLIGQMMGRSPSSRSSNWRSNFRRTAGGALPCAGAFSSSPWPHSTKFSGAASRPTCGSK